MLYLVIVCAGYRKAASTKLSQHNWLLLVMLTIVSIIMLFTLGDVAKTEELL